MNIASRLRRVLLGLSTALGCVALSLVISRCVVEDGACSEHQVPAADTMYTCKCEKGYVPDDERGYGCVKCGANETSDGVKCTCKAGFARPDDDSACEKIEGSVAGSECSPDKACTDPNPYCAESEAPSYCTTQGCAKNDDCPSKWRCGEAGGDKFCKKPPEGLGDSCQTNADCGKEAPYCETFQTHTCIINNCLSQPSVCPSSLICCDLSALIGESFCVDKSALMNGLCPGGAKPVTE